MEKNKPSKLVRNMFAIKCQNSKANKLKNFVLSYLPMRLLTRYSS